MPGFSGRRMLAVGALGWIAAMLGAVLPAAGREGPRAHHVLLLSVDGMHQSDLAWYVAQNPNSTMGKLEGSGVEFTNANHQRQGRRGGRRAQEPWPGLQHGDHSFG